MDAIGSAMMMVFDELKNDKKSKKLIQQLDEATDDATVKKGFTAAIKRLRELDKNSLADDIEKKVRGWL